MKCPLRSKILVDVYHAIPEEENSNGEDEQSSQRYRQGRHSFVCHRNKRGKILKDLSMPMKMSKWVELYIWKWCGEKMSMEVNTQYLYAGQERKERTNSPDMEAASTYLNRFRH